MVIAAGLPPPAPSLPELRKFNSQTCHGAFTPSALSIRGMQIRSALKPKEASTLLSPAKRELPYRGRPGTSSIQSESISLFNRVFTKGRRADFLRNTNNPARRCNVGCRFDFYQPPALISTALEYINSDENGFVLKKLAALFNSFESAKFLQEVPLSYTNGEFIETFLSSCLRAE